MLLTPASLHTRAQIRVTRAAVKKYNKASVFRNRAKFTASNTKLDRLEKRMRRFNEKYAAKFSKEVRA